MSLRRASVCYVHLLLGEYYLIGCIEICTADNAYKSDKSDSRNINIFIIIFFRDHYDFI